MEHKWYLKDGILKNELLKYGWEKDELFGDYNLFTYKQDRHDDLIARVCADKNMILIKDSNTKYLNNLIKDNIIEER